jgi:uncharacterized membrane protein YdjX (TVP38/TMEM64 family)
LRSPASAIRGAGLREHREARAARVGARTGFLLRRALYLAGGLIILAIALSLAWTQTPLRHYVTRENAAALADAFAGQWWAPLVVILAYTPASFVMFPRWIITTTAVLAFGPWTASCTR